MASKSIKMEKIIIDDSTIYYDINDILDILPANDSRLYSVIFNDGEVWRSVNLKKSVINKFEKIKKKRGQRP